MNSISLNLEPHQFLAGWRPDAGALFLPALSESRVGEQVVGAHRPLRADRSAPPSSARSPWSGASAARRSRPASRSTSTAPASRRRASSPWWPAASRSPSGCARPASPCERPVIVVRPRHARSRRAPSPSPRGAAPSPGPATTRQLRVNSWRCGFANGFLAPSTEAVVCWTARRPAREGPSACASSPRGGWPAWRLEETLRGAGPHRLTGARPLDSAPGPGKRRP